MCRDEAHLPMPGRADSLPRNRFLNTLLEDLDQVCGKDELKTVCGDCQQEEVTGFCHTCSKFLCPLCKTYHSKAIPTKTHEIDDDVASIQAKRSGVASTCAQVERQSEGLCSRHERPNEVYCNTCRMPVCQLCLAVDDHSNCSRAVLKDAGHEASTMLRAVLSDLSEVCKEPLKCTLDRYERGITTLDESSQSAKQEVEAYCDDLLLHVNARKQALLARIEEASGDQRSRLCTVSNHLRRDIEELDAIIHDSYQTLERSSYSAIIAESRGKERYLRQAQDKCKAKFEAEYQSGGTVVPVKFTGTPSAIEDLHALIAKVGTISPGMAKVGPVKRMVGVGTSTKVATVCCSISEDLTVSVTDPVGSKLMACNVVLEESEAGEVYVNGSGMAVAKSIYIQSRLPGEHVLDVLIGDVPADGSPFSIQSYNLASVAPRVIGPLPPKFPFASRGSFLQSPSATVLTRKSSLYVADTGNRVIKEVSLDGHDIRSIKLKAKSEPCAIAIDREGRLFVGDRAEHCIHVLTEDSAYAIGFGGKRAVEPEPETSNLFWPYSIAISPSDEVIVSDKGNGCIHAYSMKGKLLRTISYLDRQRSLFINNPAQVAVDPSSGLIYLAERGGGCVRVFNNAGECTRSIGQGVLNNPTGVAIHPVGHILVAHLVSEKAFFGVVAFDEDGDVLAEHVASSASMKGPVSLAVSEAGDIVATDSGGNAVYCFSS